MSFRGAEFDLQDAADIIPGNINAVEVIVVVLWLLNLFGELIQSLAIKLRG
jgi:hypothetical protein